MAKGTDRVVLQVDSGAAARAVHRLNGLAQMLNFGRREGMDKVFLLEEFEERQEVPVLVGADPVDEADGAGHVVRKGQTGAAARAMEQRRKRGLGRGRVLADEFHELQGSAGRELQVFMLVKPEGLTGSANVDRELDPEATAERPVGHLCGAVRTIHRLPRAQACASSFAMKSNRIAQV